MMKVTIITVVKNAKNTIARAIESVLEQSYKHIEYIVIDGMSDDGTSDIIARYGDRISRYIREPDKGIYDAMNKGIRIASGNVIGLLNADDYYDIYTVDRIVKTFEKSSVEIVYGNAMFFDSDGPKSLYSVDIDEIWEWMSIPHPATFIKKEVYDRVGIYDTRLSIAADYDLVLRCLCKGINFRYVDELLTWFNFGGISNTNRLKTYAEGKCVALKYFRYSPEPDDIVKKIYNRDFKWIVENEGHYFSDIIRKLTKGKSISIWGYGSDGKWIHDVLVRNGFNIDHVVDAGITEENPDTKRVVEKPIVLADYNGVVFASSSLYCERIKSEAYKVNPTMDVLTWNDLTESFAQQLIGEYVEPSFGRIEFDGNLS